MRIHNPLKSCRHSTSRKIFLAELEKKSPSNNIQLKKIDKKMRHHEAKLTRSNRKNHLEEHSELFLKEFSLSFLLFFFRRKTITCEMFFEFFEATWTRKERWSLQTKSTAQMISGHFNQTQIYDLTEAFDKIKYREKYDRLKKQCKTMKNIWKLTKIT